ncbi:MAG TPA: C-terminal binding protein [Oscillospiraceae bacterium]|nr:C-terminal binding protein [Oscillospiraceae bacterium]
MKVVFAEYPETRGRDVSTELGYLPKDAVVEYAVYDEKNLPAYYAAMADADAVLTGFAPIDKAAIDHMKRCKIISVQATGWNFVDDAYARSRGIAVCAVGEYCTQEVADHSMMMILALEKQVMYLQRRINTDKVWELETIQTKGVRRIEGQTLGVVGFGKIGQAVARRAQAFGMKVIAYDPYLPKAVADKLGAELVDIDELLARADVITVHMNMTAENKEFFNRETFAQMKRRPIFINVARGGMVNEDDLADALEGGIVRGAGLDVLSSESPDLTKCKLTGRDNVILTPHTAFYSEDSIEACERISIQNITHYLSGEKDKVFKLVNG